MSDNKKHPTFCILPWRHLFVSTTGTMRPCCISKEFPTRYKILKEGVNEYWNSSGIKSLRRSLIAGEKPDICSTCWEKEENNNTYSKRLGEMTWYKDLDINKIVNETGIDGSVDLNIDSYDLRLGNLCNLKCVMCNPCSSSKWVEDLQYLPPNKYDSNLRFEDVNKRNVKWPKDDELWTHLQKNYQNIRRMHFAGGEPLLHKDHTYLLKTLVELGYSKHIYLRYNTNITVLPDQILNYWKEFKRVDVWCSIDGVGKLNDYIRFPSEWSTINSSLRMLDETSNNIQIRINTTISALNVEYLPELYEFFVSSNFKKVGIASGTMHFAPDIVYDPVYLNIRILSNESKDRITKKLMTHINTVENDQYKTQITYLIHYMNSESYFDYYQTFKDYVNDIDTIRGNRYPYDLP